MNIKHLTAFLAVAESASFTQAAHRLGLTQPTVTARIKTLEESVGTLLFQRTGIGARLTPAGLRLHGYATRIVRLSEFARQEMADDADRSPLTVGSAEGLTTFRLLPLIEHMHLRHPGGGLSFQPLDGDPAALIRAERLDCAFYVDISADSEEAESAETGEGTDEDVRLRRLCREPLSLVAHPGHPLAASTRLRTEDLLGEAVLRSHHPDGPQLAFERLRAGAAGGAAGGVLPLGPLEAVKRGVGDGMGIALLPTVTVLEELRSGRLCRLAWQPPFSAYAWCAWRADLDTDPLFRSLLDTAVRLVEEQAPQRAPAPTRPPPPRPTGPRRVPRPTGLLRSSR
ncbi:LysR family transcriptional regulator [Streptomyces sp. NPDC046887]|uniref:LysR family transcriptional regulator n=1 Tax=Streptomyces sp. NPDC046887 TaxID=3155472 RepID=UPI0033FDECA2